MPTVSLTMTCMNACCGCLLNKYCLTPLFILYIHVDECSCFNEICTLARLCGATGRGVLSSSQFVSGRDFYEVKQQPIWQGTGTGQPAPLEGTDTLPKVATLPVDMKRTFDPLLDSCSYCLMCPFLLLHVCFV